jgi:hypothetical protein
VTVTAEIIYLENGVIVITITTHNSVRIPHKTTHAVDSGIVTAESVIAISHAVNESKAAVNVMVQPQSSLLFPLLAMMTRKHFPWWLENQRRWLG